MPYCVKWVGEKMSSLTHHSVNNDTSDVNISATWWNNYLSSYLPHCPVKLCAHSFWGTSSFTAQPATGVHPGCKKNWNTILLHSITKKNKSGMFKKFCNLCLIHFSQSIIFRSFWFWLSGVVFWCLQVDKTRFFLFFSPLPLSITLIR